MLPSQLLPAHAQRPVQIHAVANQKGGVGKTTIAMNLGAVAWDVLTSDNPFYQQTAESEGDPQSPVLVVSTDPQASSVFWSRRMEKNAGVPFDFDEVTDPKVIAKLRGLHQYQHIFIDTPGSLEDEQTLRQVLAVADDVLVPMVPEPLCFEPTARTIEQVITPMGKPYRVVVNNWDPRDGQTDLKETAEFIAAKRWRACNTVVRRYKLHTRAAAEGMVVTQYPRNRTAAEAREDFFRLALELGYGGPSAAPTHLNAAVA